MEEWKKVSLREATDIIGDGLHGTPLYSSDGEFAFVNGNNLSDGAVEIKADTKMCDLSEYEKYKKDLSDRTLFLSINGTIGNTAKYNGEKIILGKSACYLNVKKDYNLDFLYYVVRTPAFQSAISGVATGTTIKNVSLKTIREYEFSVPDYEVQTRIARILRAIEDKIELNHRINHNLEEQAQALYKSWFVDFEPFRGGNFVDSELGLIPEGWRVGCYNDIISSTVFGAWGEDREEGNFTHKVSCIGGCGFADVSSGIRGKTPERFILEKNFKNKRLIDKDIVVEISGGTPTVSTGRICLVSDNLLDKYSGNIVCTNFCRVIRPCSGYSSYVFYSWLDKYKSRVMFGYENGTSGIKNFQISDFMEKEPVIIPPQTVIAKFQTIVEFYQAVIQRNGNERMECETVRDTLLPKLMSGELIISDLTC